MSEPETAKACIIREEQGGSACGQPWNTDLTTQYSFGTGEFFSFVIPMCEMHTKALVERYRSGEFQELN